MKSLKVLVIMLLRRVLQGCCACLLLPFKYIAHKISAIWRPYRFEQRRLSQAVFLLVSLLLVHQCLFLVVLRPALMHMVRRLVTLLYHVFVRPTSIYAMYCNCISDERPPMKTNPAKAGPSHSSSLVLPSTQSSSASSCSCVNSDDDDVTQRQGHDDCAQCNRSLLLRYLQRFAPNKKSTDKLNTQTDKSRPLKTVQNSSSTLRQRRKFAPATIM